MTRSKIAFLGITETDDQEIFSWSWIFEEKTKPQNDDRKRLLFAASSFVDYDNGSILSENRSYALRIRQSRKLDAVADLVVRYVDNYFSRNVSRFAGNFYFLYDLEDFSAGDLAFRSSLFRNGNDDRDLFVFRNGHEVNMDDVVLYRMDLKFVSDREVGFSFIIKVEYNVFSLRSVKSFDKLFSLNRTADIAFETFTIDFDRNKSVVSYRFYTFFALFSLFDCELKSFHNFLHIQL